MAVVVPKQESPWTALAPAMASIGEALGGALEKRMEKGDLELLSQAGQDPQQIAAMIPKFKSQKYKDLGAQYLVQQALGSKDTTTILDPSGKPIGTVKGKVHAMTRDPEAAINLRAEKEAERQGRLFQQQNEMQTRAFAHQDASQAQREAAAEGRQAKMFQQQMTLQDMREDARANREANKATQEPKTDFQVFAQGQREFYRNQGWTDDGAINRAISDGWQKRQIEIAQGKRVASAPLTPADETLANLLAQGKIAPQELSKRTGNYNAVIAKAAEINPAFDPQKADMNFSAGRTASFRQKAITIEAMPEILDKTAKAGKDLDLSDAKFLGAIEMWSRGQMNDPKFTRYMTLRNDALLSIAGVMRGVNATDQAHRVEMEAASPTLSPRALDAWLKAQMDSLEPRMKGYRDVYGQDFGKSKPHGMKAGEALTTPDGTYTKGEDGKWHLQQP